MNDADYIGLDVQVPSGLQIVRRAANCAIQYRHLGFKAESRVAENEIRTEILDVAEDWHADVIVLGSHGEKGLKKFLMGSVAESVAHHAHCSVQIVRRP